VFICIQKDWGKERYVPNRPGGPTDEAELEGAQCRTAQRRRRLRCGWGRAFDGEPSGVLAQWRGYGREWRRLRMEPETDIAHKIVDCFIKRINILYNWRRVVWSSRPMAWVR